MISFQQLCSRALSTNNWHGERQEVLWRNLLYDTGIQQKLRAYLVVLAAWHFFISETICLICL